MLLQLLQLLQPVRLVNVGRVRVCAGRRTVLLACLEDVLDALERDGDEARVVADEQVAKRLDAPLRDEVLDLFRRAAARRVGDGPGCLLFDVELCRREQQHEGRDDVGLDDGLDLLARARRDVGDGPARLLPDPLLGRVEQREQSRQSAAVDHLLRLVVVARDDVARGAQRGRLHARRRVAHQLHDPRADARVEHLLDLVVWAVGEVRQRPARVGENLVVVGEDELREDGERADDVRPLRLGFAAAQVGERPRRVAQHRHLGRGLQLLEQRLQRALREHQVAALGRVTRDVAERPDGLLPHVVVGRHQELHKDGHRPVGDHHPRVLRRARRDVGQRPRALKLQHRVVAALQELHKARDDARGDHLLDGRRALDRQQLSELRHRRQLLVRVL
mmetsp:Transcript_45701/g.148556  ORF Transcript_45701/g.148556 Transcript_45701/m.148556 type:complete len:391 (-) Transcript_45701:305-1477(-)